MDLSVEQMEAGIVIHVAVSRIDAAGAITFRDRMKELTDNATGRVDLGEVTFINSSGLGAVVAAMKQLDPGRALELAALTPAIEKVFHLTRMDTVFRIHASVDAAKEALQQAG